jgi:hypothetical protein
VKIKHESQRKWEGTTAVPLEEMRTFLTEVHDAAFMSKAVVRIEINADQGQYGKGAQVWLTARWDTGKDDGDEKPPDLSESLE